MTFDTVRFCDDYGIAYWPPGENVSQGNVGVTCPFCDDTYNHLGIPQTGAWNVHCWKCGTHKLTEYIEQVTGLEPRPLLAQYRKLTSDIAMIAPAFKKRKKENKNIKQVQVPGIKKFPAFVDKYLEDRNFDPEYLKYKYNIKVANSMDNYYSNRIIIPQYYRGTITSFQGRTYIGEVPKYKTCHPDFEKIFHKSILFNLDNCQRDVILVVEGAFDVFRMGDNSAHTFGTSVVPEQLLLLKNNYRRVFVWFDPEERAQKKALEMCETLTSMGTVCENIYIEGSDPGDISDDDALYVKKELGL